MEEAHLRGEPQSGEMVEVTFSYNAFHSPSFSLPLLSPIP